MKPAIDLRDRILAQLQMEGPTLDETLAKELNKTVTSVLVLSARSTKARVC